MPDPIVPYTPFGTIPSYPPSPAKLDRTLDAQNHQILNVDWSGDKINLTTDVTGQLPYANIQNVTAQRLLGRDSGTGIVQEIIIGSNLTLTGGTLSAATSGGAGSGDFSTNTSTSVVNEIVLFSNTGGKQGKRSTGTGVCSLASGVLSVGPVPLSGNVTGTLPAANFPALTGNVTTTAGSLATTIAAGVVTNTMLAGGVTAANLVGTDIATVGTITAGVWNATAIPVAYGGTGASSAAAARANLGIQTTTTNGDSDYSITATDSTVALNAALTAVRTWTLPQASTVNNGTTIKVTDAVAGVSSSNYIQIAPFAGDTINGSANSFLLNKAYGVAQLTKASSTNWTVLSTTSIVRRVFVVNQTYTTPVGIKAIYVEVVAGGGAGGGAALASSNISLGSGGGGGGYASAYFTSPAASYLITIGLGGTGVSGANGNAGNATTFGTLTANPGAGGITMAAGSSLAITAGAGGGGGSSGDFASVASAGGAAIRLSATVGISGCGGASAFAFGGNTVQKTADGSSPAGQLYGSGGGGAFTDAAAVAGGNGAQGICLVTEYY